MKQLRHVAATAAVLAALLSAGTAQAQWSTAGNTGGAGILLGATNTAAGSELIFKTSNLERGRIQIGGNVGWNTTTPGRKLELHVGSTIPQLTLSETSTTSWQLWGGREFHISDGETGLDWLFFSPAAYLDLFTLGPNAEVAATNLSTGALFGFGATPVTKLTVAGHVVPATDNANDVGSLTRRWDTVFACNGVIQTSDARMKENIHEIPYGIHELMQLHPVSFSWNDRHETGRQLGMLAQEIQPVISEVVKEGTADARLGVFYSDFIPVLIGSIQDQQNKIRERAAENQELRTQLNERTERITRLEAAVRAMK